MRMPTNLYNASHHLLSLLFGLAPHHHGFKHGFTWWEKTKKLIEQTNTHEYYAIALLDTSNIGAKLPRSGAGTKSRLNLMLIC